MANQIVNVNIVADTKKFSSAMRGAGKDTDFLTSGLKKIGIAAGVAFAAAAAGAVAFGVESVKAAAEAEAINRTMENAVKNAGLFGDSSQDIAKATKALDEHSKTVGELIGVDDELFNKIKTGWLSVPSLAALGTKGINKLAQVTADVAAGTGKDLESIALMFTKTAGDTETALGKLTRAGVVLSKEQKQTYEDLIAVNDEAGAQAYLIEQLGIKYKGAAAAAANPFERLKVIIENLQETIGGALLPAFDDAIPKLQALISEMVSSPEFEEFLANLATSLQSMLDSLFRLADEILPALNPLLQILADTLELVAIGLENSSANSNEFLTSLEALSVIVSAITDGIKAIDEAAKNTSDSFSTWGVVGKAAVDGIIRFLNPLYEILKPIAALIEYINGNYMNAAKLLGIDTSNVVTTGPGGPNFQNRPKLAEGGIVMPRPGGVPVTVAEAGQPEAVIPLNKIGSMGTTININGNVGWSPTDLANIISRKQRQAMALNGLNGIIGVR